ncbi:xanthine dehydrogenase accessory factor [Catenuloplanes nepalensis]|uniref:Xanthine dehydrogenase accessory factor n=1 Tax=Catenuloplanes nepalensis TaxID=587533 RepID=A0ABT9MX86_9ACTN|nr:XdhC/CoxI family protein [Catenuloplanes nepalensis]MDP9796055.1 xanthine dehydrogenase accessory factor [Catenuloplanes nepalensis]
MLTEVWPFLAAHAGERVVLARLVRRDGPGSRPVGATMAIAAGGAWTGSVSGGCVEGVVLDEARAVLGGGEPRLVTVSPGEHLMPWEAAPACDGVLHVLIVPAPPPAVHAAIGAALAADRPVTVGVELAAPWTWRIGPGEGFTETLRPGPRLVVAGATDLAASLAVLGRAAGRRVQIVDPRESHARPEMFPGAGAVVRAWPDTWLAAHPPSAADAVVAITHDPRIDDRALRAALDGAAGYVGALGSRETHRRRLARLAGTPGLDRLAGPAGLDLGGGSIAETALSILAEVVAAANGRDGGRLSGGSAPIRALPDSGGVELPAATPGSAGGACPVLPPVPDASDG